MKDKVKTLLTSSIKEDFLIGLELIKDWSWEKIKELGESYIVGDMEGITLEVKNKQSTDWNYQSANFYCHRNMNVFIYKGKSTLKFNKYEKI